MIEYLSVAQVLALHRGLVDDFGGALGVRDRGSLESAVARPAATFSGEDLYGDLADKAAALMHPLVLNHPFVDGDKRVAVHAAEFFLEVNGCLLTATNDDLEVLTLAAAEGRVAVEALAVWLRQRLKDRND